MLRLGVVGGRLQGTEAVYLGIKAGFEVVLVDRAPATAASGLATESHVFDPMTDVARARAVLGSCDVVLPACEDLRTLRWLSDVVPSWDVPVAFHLPSYELSCSKIRSDRLFAELDVPRPLPWPDCGYPAVVKPSGASGSEGVSVVWTERDLEMARARLETDGHEVVVQQYVDGPSLSLEVIGTPDGALPLVPTLLEFDHTYDCKRVIAPVTAGGGTLEALSSAGVRLAEGLGLVGVMDIEVMLDGDVPRVIEIDARLPSQTPTVVLHSTGINMVALMVDAARGAVLPASVTQYGRGVSYQHVRASAGRLEVFGEHVMSTAGPLRLLEDVFGADEVLTDRDAVGDTWSATLICTGRDAEGARSRAELAVRRMAADSGLMMAPENAPRAEPCRT